MQQWMWPVPCGLFRIPPPSLSLPHCRRFWEAAIVACHHDWSEERCAAEIGLEEAELPSCAARPGSPRSARGTPVVSPHAMPRNAKNTFLVQRSNSRDFNCLGWHYVVEILCWTCRNGQFVVASLLVTLVFSRSSRFDGAWFLPNICLQRSMPMECAV